MMQNITFCGTDAGEFKEGNTDSVVEAASG
jgi:hypothetical protein